MPLDIPLALSTKTSEARHSGPFGVDWFSLLVYNTVNCLAFLIVLKI